MTIWILLSLLQFLSSLSYYKKNLPNFDASLLHAPAYRFTLTPTMVSRAQAAQAALKARQEAEEKRLQTKKTRLEEKQQATEAAKVKAAIEAEVKRVEEANKQAAMENAVSPDSSTIDQPDANINNYLAAVNDPNANKSNDNNNVFSSPKKNKQKTTKLKNPKNNPLANHAHKHSRILISGSILLSGSDEKERTQQNVMNMRELLNELQLINETTRLNHLYKAGSIWKPEEISVNQTKFGAYFLISSFNNKNPFSKQSHC
jgi:hypothetical protein